jgi:hypothetical protein
MMKIINPLVNHAVGFGLQGARCDFPVSKGMEPETQNTEPKTGKRMADFLRLIHKKTFFGAFGVSHGPDNVEVGLRDDRVSNEEGNLIKVAFSGQVNTVG